jgi:hypothetical protein
MFFFPILVGLLGAITTYIFSKDEDFSMEEGIKITKVMWAVMAVGALILLLS